MFPRLAWCGGQWRGGEIVGGIRNAREEKCLAALDAGAADSAVGVSAFVAGPCLREIDAEFRAAASNGGFIHVDERAGDFHSGVGAFPHGLLHALHEGLAAVRINGVVARVCGDDEPAGAGIFCHTSGDGEQDAVAKWHDGLFHAFLGVVAVGDGVSALQQAAFEQLGDKIDVDDAVRDAEVAAMPCGVVQFAGIVLGAVVEAQRELDFAIFSGVVEGGDGVHAAAEEHDGRSLFHERTWVRQRLENRAWGVGGGLRILVFYGTNHLRKMRDLRHCGTGFFFAIGEDGI